MDAATHSKVLDEIIAARRTARQATLLLVEKLPEGVPLSTTAAGQLAASVQHLSGALALVTADLYGMEAK